MSTALHSPALPFVPIPALETALPEIEAAAVHQAESDAAQAVAVFRRVEASLAAAAASAEDGLDELSIDDLRRLACELHVPQRSKITEKAELIAEIRLRM
jgi:hypothetical protein